MQEGLNSEQEMRTMDFGFIRSIVSEPLPCARIEVRRRDLGTVGGLLGERNMVEHRDVRAWAS